MHRSIHRSYSAYHSRRGAPPAGTQPRPGRDVLPGISARQDTYWMVGAAAPAHTAVYPARVHRLVGEKQIDGHRLPVREIVVRAALRPRIRIHHRVVETLRAKKRRVRRIPEELLLIFLNGVISLRDGVIFPSEMELYPCGMEL